MTDFEVKTPYGVVEVTGVAQVLHMEGDTLAFLDAEDRTIAGFQVGSWSYYRRIEATEAAEPVAIVANEGDVLSFEQFAKTPVGTKSRDKDDDIWTNLEDEGPRWTHHSDGHERYWGGDDVADLVTEYNEFVVIR